MGAENGRENQGGVGGHYRFEHNESLTKIARQFQNHATTVFFLKLHFTVFQWVYFHPPVHFQEVFGRYLWNGPSTLKIEKSHF